MDESLQRLRGAAQAGDIDALYAAIQDATDVFHHIDQMKFVDTPLHIAAAAGHIDFAMEIMNLNPSFARKLNQCGQSPIHLALQNQQDEMVINLLSADKDLVRVKGREGYTAFHIVAKDGNVPLLSQFLEQCPDCILDLTIRKETALHIAARNNRLEAFKAILHFIQRGTIFEYPYKIQKKRILNLQDRDGNTVLHIAASNNQPQMITQLVKCSGIDTNMINGKGLTASKVLTEQTQIDNKEIVNILHRAEYSCLRSFKVSRFRTTLARDLTEMKLETINALLVVFALILTMTYPALLSPPRGIFQGDVGSRNVEKPVMAVNGPPPAAPKPDDSKNVEISVMAVNGPPPPQSSLIRAHGPIAGDPGPGDSKHVGESAFGPFGFLLFFIPNGIAFLMAWSLTLVLLSLVAKSMMWFVFPLYLLMWFCYSVASYAIAPGSYVGWIASGVPSIFIVLVYLFSFYRLKKY